MSGATEAAALPPDFEPPLDSERFASLLRHLADSRARLLDLEEDAIWSAWCTALAALLDPTSELRLRLDPGLIAARRLSPSGLQAALSAIGSRLLEPDAHARFAATKPRTARVPVAMAVLSGNVPGLALQSLLPALACRRPMLFKTATAEPLSTPAFVTELARHLAPLADCYAALWWRGGDSPLERVAQECCEPVLAYGRESSIASIRRSIGDRLIEHGPRLSIAVLDLPAETSLDLATARALARDVALFDQRGCLSVQLVFTSGCAESCAERLASALAALAAGPLEPGPATPEETAAARLAIEEAVMRGAPIYGAPGAGYVIVERSGRLLSSPGRRSVRLIPVASIDHVPELLRTGGVALQGAALHGERAWQLTPRLESLGCTRVAAPGELQTTGVEWRNAGVDLFELLR